MKKNTILTKDNLSEQFEYMSKIAQINNGKEKYIYIQTLGCQQNEADSEKLLGMALEMGYKKTNKPENASLLLVNTCAVREHAELKALSIAGGFKKFKKANPDLLIGICGCMVSQEHRKEDVKKSYPYIDFLLGSTLIHRLPEILYNTIVNKNRNFWIDNDLSVIAEDIPVMREKNSPVAYVSVMYGCNNYCTYCIVPYVRGRERSRMPDVIINEIKGLISDGVKEITLLGQNVNSYGKDIPNMSYDFSDLISDICKLEGEAVLHFMTSHPKDATRKLIDVMAQNPPKSGKIGISPKFHLPIQSGNDRILKAMNRGYTVNQYLKLVEYMREKIPDISITTDIIVGFPSETEEEFLDTLKTLETAQYDGVFSFVFSKRSGTPAANMPRQIPGEVKSKRIKKLIDTQNDILRKKNSVYLGKTLRVLVEGKSKTNENMLTSRTEKNKIVHFPGGEELFGSYVYVKIQRADAHALHGVLTDV